MADPTLREHSLAQSAAPTVSEGVPVPAAPTALEGSVSIDAASAATSITLSAARPRVNLPARIEQEYAWERDLPSGGSEADCSLIRHRETGTLFFFKHYRRGYAPDEDALRVISDEGDTSHVVELVDFSSDNQDAWEIQEYCPLGTLETGTWVEEHPRPLPEDILIDVLHEAAQALHHIHGLGETVVHRDIKPSNILVRRAEPLDLVLTDFGIARANIVATMNATRIAGTPIYHSPETYQGIITQKSDWFSLGVVVYELHTGKRIYENVCSDDASPQRIQDACTRALYRDAVNNLKQDRLRSLLKGLLTYDRRYRWGFTQVSAWLAGEDPDVFEQGWATTRLEENYQVPGTGELLSTPDELARYFAAHWTKACGIISGRYAKDVAVFLRRFEGADRAVKLLEEQINAERTLVALQFILAPNDPVLFRDAELSTASLKAQIEEASRDNENAQKWLSDICSLRILSLWASYTNDETTSKAAARLEEWRIQASEAINLVVDANPEDERKLRELGWRSFEESLPELFELAYTEKQK